MLTTGGSPGIRVTVPWGSWLGLARTLLAAATMGTLVFSDADTLFTPLLGLGSGPHCTGLASVGVFCLAGRQYADLVRWGCVAVLLVVASGWRPRFTALPHWWISFSLATSMSIPDGGDHANQVLTLLLVPVLLGDARRWHWQAPPLVVQSRRVAVGFVAVATVMLFAIRLQVAGIYFQSSVAKLSHAEWADGTVMYYWLNHPGFGAPHWLQPVTDWLVDQPLLLVGLAWTPLVIEFGLAVSLLMRPAVRWWLLPAGVLLHLNIALAMGLWSFALTMFAAIVLLIVPAGAQLTETRDSVIAAVSRWRARRGGGPMQDERAGASTEPGRPGSGEEPDRSTPELVLPAPTAGL